MTDAGHSFRGREDSVYSDLGLIRKMKQGDDAAFDQFVHKYYAKILRYCQYRCLDQDYAMDLTQETFVRFFAKLAVYHDSGKTLQYLYTIAGNLCKDYYKKRKEMPVDEPEAIKQEPGQEDQMENAINRIFIEQALLQLPEDLREVVILHYFSGLKLTEVSETLQIGLPLVKYRLKRAKKQLEKLL